MKITRSMTVGTLLDKLNDYSEDQANGEILTLELTMEGTWMLSSVDTGEIFRDNEQVIYD